MLNAIALINKGLIEKKKYIKVIYSLTALKIVKLFYSKGHISSYHIMYGTIHIELNIYENAFTLNDFRFYKTSQHRRYVTCKQLKRLVFMDKNKLLLSTSKGILSSDMALKYNIGGILLMNYY